MGPRSSDRGSVTLGYRNGLFHEQLQWVHGPRTVVRLQDCLQSLSSVLLQWVHGPRTVVRDFLQSARIGNCAASMGPRSSDRGSGMVCQMKFTGWEGFNGSTVLGPWF